MSLLLPPLPPTFQAALRDVRARRPEMRVAAAERLAEPESGREAEALAGLLDLCEDRDARVRSSALMALRGFTDPRVPRRLREGLDDPHALVREVAVIALAQHTDGCPGEVLRGALESAHPEVRFQAAIALGEAGEPLEPGVLAHLLSDSDPRVRAGAARALAGLGDAGREQLSGALEDRDPGVRREAGLSLLRLGDPRGSRAARDALEDPELVVEALDAIGGLEAGADPGLAHAVAAIAESMLKPLSLKTAAARALCRLGDPRGVPALRSVLRAFRREGRSYAVEVVGELGLCELAPELRRLVDRPRGADPRGLCAALAALGPGCPEALEGLRAMASRKDEVGAEAREKLEQSNNSRDPPGLPP